MSCASDLAKDDDTCPCLAAFVLDARISLKLQERLFRSRQDCLQNAASGNESSEPSLLIMRDSAVQVEGRVFEGRG